MAYECKKICLHELDINVVGQLAARHNHARCCDIMWVGQLIPNNLVGDIFPKNQISCIRKKAKELAKVTNRWVRYIDQALALHEKSLVKRGVREGIVCLIENHPCNNYTGLSTVHVNPKAFTDDYGIMAEVLTLPI